MLRTVHEEATAGRGCASTHTLVITVPLLPRPFTLFLLLMFFLKIKCAVSPVVEPAIRTHVIDIDRFRHRK